MTICDKESIINGVCAEYRHWRDMIKKDLGGIDLFDLSVCIPVYNDEKFISGCIESIITGLDDNIEIILVNDGSVDKSRSICEKYALKYDNIRLINQTNGGASSARNTAIKNAKGKWLAFVDGDDRLVKGALDIMREYFKSSADIVSFSFTESENVKGNDNKYDVCHFTGKDIDNYLAENFHHVMWKEYNFSHVCGKLFKRQFVIDNNILFNDNISQGEDTVFSFCCESRAREVIVDTRCVYKVTNNLNSSTNNFCSDIAERYDDFVLYAKKAIMESGKWNNHKIVIAFYCHIVYIIKMSMKLGAYHPDCKWGRDKRIAWLKKLCSMPWVIETVNFDDYGNLLSGENIKLINMMGDKNFDAIDRRWKYLHIRAGIIRNMYSTKTGTFILKTLKRIINFFDFGENV